MQLYHLAVVVYVKNSFLGVLRKERETTNLYTVSDYHGGIDSIATIQTIEQHQKLLRTKHFYSIFSDAFELLLLLPFFLLLSFYKILLVGGVIEEI